MIDKVNNEWCEFDNVDVDLTEDKTFMWYMANQVNKLIVYNRDYIERLGNGLLYDGLMDTKGTLSVKNVVENGYVLTYGVFEKTKVDGSKVKEDIGLLFDRDWDEQQGKFVRGKMVNGLIDTTNGTTDVFILKDVSMGKNNCNSIQIAKRTWDSNYKKVKVGTMTVDEDDGTISVEWDDDAIDTPETIEIYPASDTQYTVTYMFDGSEQYTVRKYARTYIHFVARGGDTQLMNRYRINTLTKEVDMLMFNNMEDCSTLDFSTSFTPDAIRDSLVRNIKQCMFNEMLSQVVENTSPSAAASTAITFSTTTSDLDKYLELQTDDTHLANYMKATDVHDFESKQIKKFKEVYKNNVKEVDETLVFKGDLYNHLIANHIN